jgi:hypothetical protein
LLLSLGIVVAAWWWLATPVALSRAPIDAVSKLECVSYAPFRNEQTPHDPTLIVSPQQIAEDLAELAKVTKCIRTYSTRRLARARSPEECPAVRYRGWAGERPSRHGRRADRRQRGAAAR